MMSIKRMAAILAVTPEEALWEPSSTESSSAIASTSTRAGARRPGAAEATGGGNAPASRRSPSAHVRRARPPSTARSAARRSRAPSRLRLRAGQPPLPPLSPQHHSRVRQPSTDLRFHQLAVPAQERARSDDEWRPTLARQQARQRRQEHLVAAAQLGAAGLALENREFMAKDQQPELELALSVPTGEGTRNTSRTRT
jgi:hypothetical protein